MKKLLAAVLLLGPLVAGAQAVSTTPSVDQPPSAQPQAAPPPPAGTPPPPSSGAPQAPLPPESGDEYTADQSEPLVEEVPSTAVAPAPGNGQWVYTAQYGWVWMPYGAAYTYLPADAYPDMYLYAPAYGWRWVVAPWVWGIGPRPFFGVYGFARFPWYGRGYGRWYGFRGGPVWAGRGWGHPGWYGHAPHPVVRPAPHAFAPRPGSFGGHGFSGGRPGGMGGGHGFSGGHPGGMGGGHAGGFGRR